MSAIHPSIILSLGGCFILLAYILLEDYLGKLIKRGILGCLTILVINACVPSSMVIGWSIWSIGIACLFGMPGVVLMYLIQLIL